MLSSGTEFGNSTILGLRYKIFRNLTILSFFLPFFFNLFKKRENSFKNLNYN